METLFKNHPDFTTTKKLTPIQKSGGIHIKRDDFYEIAGVCGGKVRTCFVLAKGAKGLVTAGSRQSPQVNIVAHIAQHLDIPCHAHTPTGVLSPELLEAQKLGATIIQHKAGYNSVIIARARDDAGVLGWTNIPFGMDCWEAVNQTQAQVENLPQVERIVVPVGSGMTLAGILWGLKNYKKQAQVLGVVVGADPIKRLDKYAPPNWREVVKLVKAREDYHTLVDEKVGDIALDPIYEAKCKRYLLLGDLLWVVGIRNTWKKA